MTPNMTAELRRLLTEAMPGKLRPDGWHVYVGAGMRKRDVAQTFTEQDARLIAVAVNVLPALLNVMEAAEDHLRRVGHLRAVDAALRAALAKLEEHPLAPEEKGEPE